MIPACTKQHLEELILANRYLYYVAGCPLVSDAQYDHAKRMALELLPSSSAIRSPASADAEDYTEKVRLIAVNLLAHTELIHTEFSF